MPDRTFGDPVDDNDGEWIRRRNDLVAELRGAPRQSRALRRFSAALARHRRSGRAAAGVRLARATRAIALPLTT